MKKFLLTIAPFVLLLFGCVWFSADLLTACLVIISIAVLFIFLNWWTNFVANHFDD